MKKTALACFALFCAPHAVWAQNDDNSGNEASAPVAAPQETVPVLPALPDEQKLLAFRVGTLAPGRFLLDPESLKMSEDGITRFVLVMRGSSGGANSITFEGIRCGTGERILYASADRNGWHPVKNGTWRALDGGNRLVNFDYHGNDPRAALAHDYLCDGNAPRRERDIIAQLRNNHIDFLKP
ncbi:MAG: CNP1-like family protein [Azoarcus sp.]|jgi:hypothetical protein|nr:CNP1-like family protein [Azoarcus sp.]